MVTCCIYSKEEGEKGWEEGGSFDGCQGNTTLSPPLPHPREASRAPADSKQLALELVPFSPPTMRALSLFLILLTLLAVLGSTVGKYSPPGKPVSWICYTTGGGERERVREGKRRGVTPFAVLQASKHEHAHIWLCMCIVL